MFALLIYLYLIGFNHFLILFCFLLGTIFPDIDSKNSFISRHLQFLKLHYLVHHRTIFHSFFFPAMYFVIAYFYNFRSDYVNWFFFGYVLHLVLDAFTIRGINFLYPIRFEVRGFIKVGSFLEYVLFAISGILVLFYLFNEFGLYFYL